MQSKENKLSIYERAIEKWGSSFQLKMVAEECAELIKSVLKFDRKTNGSNIDDIVEEIVDVEIMIGQLKIILSKYDTNLEWLLKENKKSKLERLDRMLNEK